MADGTAIAWAHATINAISGCTPVSPGCTNCYAMRAGGHHRPHHPSNGLTQPSRAGHVWTGAVRLNEDWLRKPLSWSKPRRIFWNAHGDPWHESVPFEWVDREMAVAALTPQHRHLFLTKRSGRMRRYFDNPATPERILEAAKQLKGLPTSWSWPLPNVWLGISAEDQPRADERIADLLATPAAVRWISAEPLLSQLNLTDASDCGTALDPECWGDCRCDSLYGYDPGCRRNGGDGQLQRKIDWVVAGGESGPGARPMHPDWARSLRDQCAEAGVPFLLKQWGEWVPREWRCDGGTHAMHRNAPNYGVFQKLGHHPNSLERTSADGGWQAFEKVGKRAAGRLLDGVLHDAYPELFAWEIADRAAQLKELAHA